jgi:hypothetical protein
MVGRGYGPAHMMGADAATAALQTAAAQGDPRAQAICQAIQQAGCGPPAWRDRQIAPGVQVPCDDLVPLPLTPVLGTPTFVNGGPTIITLTGKTQKPFRGERPMANVLRVGASAANIIPVIRGGITVGVDPQVAQKADQPLEQFTANAFGARMQMVPADPGVEITADIVLVGGALAVGDTLTVFLSIFGSFLQ